MITLQEMAVFKSGDLTGLFLYIVGCRGASQPKRIEKINICMKLAEMKF